jgi:hypothetical protein
MDRDRTQGAKPSQSWWVGTAKRLHILLKLSLFACSLRC